MKLLARTQRVRISPAIAEQLTRDLAVARHALRVTVPPRPLRTALIDRLERNGEKLDHAAAVLIAEIGSEVDND